MGIDSIKSKVAGVVKEATEVLQRSAVPGSQPAVPGTAPVEPTEGFVETRKKLVSMSGRHPAFKPTAPVVGLRAGTVSSLKDASVDTAATQGRAPPARPAASDFAAQAKARLPKTATPAEVDAAANKLAREAIQRDFGMTVKDGDKKWTTEELSRAHESFASMPKADQTKLKGLDLIRDAAAPPESQAEMKNGIVAGEYNPNTETKDGKRLKNGSISLYDAAFPTGKDSRQASMHVILHEAGHAVEGRSRDDAMVEWSKANDARSTAVDRLNTTVEPNNTAWSELNSANRAVGRASTKDKPKMDFISASNSVTGALDKIQTAKTPKQLSDAQAELTAAKAKRDAALGKMSGHKDEAKAKAAVSAADEVEKTATAMGNARVGVQTSDTALASKLGDLKKVATVTVKKVDGKDTTSAESSTELADFKAARGKEKPVSGYGKTAAAEGYAEAYALYQRDPEHMKNTFPNQYKFFHAKHPSPADT